MMSVYKILLRSAIQKKGVLGHFGPFILLIDIKCQCPVAGHSFFKRWPKKQSSFGFLSLKKAFEKEFCKETQNYRPIER